MIFFFTFCYSSASLVGHCEYYFLEKPLLSDLDYLLEACKAGTQLIFFFLPSSMFEFQTNPIEDFYEMDKSVSRKKEQTKK